MTSKIISDIEWLIRKIKDLPKEKITTNLVELAERIRVFPKGTPFPGRQKFAKTPYMTEIAMELSPSSDTEEVVFMKASQIGATAGSTEPLILFKIVEDPGPILAITANDELARTWNNDRIDPMLEASGVISTLKSKIDKNNQHGGKGNSALSKTWPGGRLDIRTYGKVSQLRQISYQIVILEEEEEADNAAQRGMKQGKFRDVAYARTRAYKGRRKILRVSTPLIKQFSVIYKAFKAGDQRYYYVPCPSCGTKQRLIWSSLKYKTNERKIVIPNSVYYECKNDECDYKIKNTDKTKMLPDHYHGGKAEWRPHNAENARPKTKSYQISALYAPIGMETWEDLAQQWVDSQGDHDKMQTFINLQLGEPFEDFADRPPAEMLHSLKGMYKAGEMPKEDEGKPLFTTLGCDVQAGNKRGGSWVPGKEARIEASLYGHGENGREWLIDHYVMIGSTNDYRSGAFKTLKDKILQKDFPMMPFKIFIDSRHQTDEVNKFCNGSANVFPIMGHNYITKNPGSKYFKIVEMDNFRSASGAKLKMYELSTNIMKRRLYNKLSLKRDPLTGEFPKGYLMFPVDMKQRFFDKLTAERPMVKNISGRLVTVWDAGGRANEPMDTYIYAGLAKEAFIHEISIAFGEEAANENKFWTWAANKFGEIE